MRSGKGEIILEEDSRQWKNSAIKRPRVAASTSVSFLFWRVTELQGMIENILCLQVFSLKVLKFDLYLSKQSISRALKRALKRAYLMIVGQSLHFTSCYWRCNLCTAIFHRRVWSMNSKEWLPKFYAFKFCSPTVFNFDFHKIEKGILRALQRDLSTRCVWSMFASRAFSYIPISTCQITIEIYKREERKPSGNKLGSFGEKKNQAILFWNARPTEYDAESAWKKWTRFLTKFTANANGKFRLLFFLSNRPNREIHNYLLIIINVDTFTLLLLKLKGRRQSSILASCRSHTRGGFK